MVVIHMYLKWIDINTDPLGREENCMELLDHHLFAADPGNHGQTEFPDGFCTGTAGLTADRFLRKTKHIQK